MRCFLFSIILLSTLSLSAQNPADVAARTQLDTRFAPFYHGVASGDPLSDRVIIWTRLTTSDPGPATVGWEVGTDTAMSNIVKFGTFTTSDSIDYTVKVDVTGLQPGTWYYYRFIYNGRASLTGRTYTAPVGDVDSLRFAIVSCTNYPGGWFNAYGNLANRNDIHAVLHLGDYIYESGGSSDDRDHEPPGEILSLSDYRIRHSQYKLDADSRCIHQMYPFITVWDDHESSNNAWKGGAEGHDTGDGPWPERKATAVKAYHEWMPIRTPDVNDSVRIYRRIQYGDLIEFFMLDTRLYARDEQVTGNQMGDPGRHLLGPDQLGWLSDGMKTTSARWKMLGQQVMMAPLEAFGFPLNPDQWDGYSAERDRLYDTILTHNIEDVVVLTGDIHTAWANDLPGAAYDPGTGANSVGVEFITASVTTQNSVVQFGSQLIQLGNPHVKFVNLDDHGYFILDVNKTRTQADFFKMDDIDTQNNYDYAHDASWYVNHQERHLNEAQDTVPATQAVQSLQPTKTPPNPAISINDPSDPGGAATLIGAYPNPFQDAFTVQYYLHRAGRVQWALTDLQGKIVYAEEAGKQAPGLHEQKVKNLVLSKATYLFSLSIDGKVLSRRMVRN